MNPQTVIIQRRTRQDDGIGGYDDVWVSFLEVKGYLDMVNGTDLNGQQNAYIEQSTHMLIIPDIPSEEITDKMRVAAEGKVYDITFVDDPVNVHHHLEVYLTFAGVEHG